MVKCKVRQAEKVMPPGAAKWTEVAKRLVVMGLTLKRKGYISIKQQMRLCTTIHGWLNGLVSGCCLAQSAASTQGEPV